MDLSEAFDWVGHNIFLSKLKRYGIHETALQIVIYQTVNILSPGTRLTHLYLINLNIGVPQDSILGPLLSLIYINDIVNSSNILSFVHFDDDTTVMFNMIQLMVQFKSLISYSSRTV